MAATIKGIVFNDLNSNGQYDPGEPGIADAYVVLSGTSGCTTAQTDASGNYSFSATAGTYTIYETVEQPNACPPTAFSQPSGFNVSNGPRKLSVTVTAAQSNNGATIANNNFSHAFNDNPFECNSIMIQFAGIPTVRYNIDTVTGESVAQGTLNPADYVNAIGQNPLDSFIYGYDQTTHHIVRVDADNNITTMLPNPTGLPSADYTTGCFDGNGFFYLYAVNTARYYTVDLRPDSPTYMKLVNPTAGFVEQTSNYGVALSTPIDVSDWAINPQDGNLYGVNRSGNVVRVVPTTGVVSVLTTTGPKESVQTSYGACAFDFNGNLYVIANLSGIIRKYTINGNTANGELFSQSVVTSNNDGTMCFFAAVNVDYGDAPDLGAGNGPDNYNTLLENDGPRHGLINELYLGTQVTAEANAYQNFDATGDDIPLGIQDDGLAVPLEPLAQSGGVYVLNVTVTNHTGQTANLYGWIDYNQNGLFESDEAAIAVQVPSLAGVQNVPLVFGVPVGIVSGHTFVRIRLTTDNLTDLGGVQDTRSVGSASDGEVEDYIINITPSADLAVVKTGSPNPVKAGDELTYTIVINNAGPDTAVNTVLTDDVPPQMIGAEYSTDNGISWQPWTGAVGLGNLSSGDNLTVLIRGKVAPFAVGAFENTAVVSSDTFDPDLDNNTSTNVTEVVEIADLAVKKTGEPSPVMTGQILVYTIDVINFGPSDAVDTVITDAIPPQLANPEYSTDGGVSWQPWNGSLNIGTVHNNETVTVLIRGIVTADVGVIINTVSVDSPTPDPDPNNNHATELTPINNSADLSVTKTGSPKPVISGGQILYGIIVTNSGPNAAVNTVLTDIVPAELLNVEYSTDGGTTWQPWNGFLGLGTLAPNISIQIFIRATVSPAAVGTIENTAVVSSDTPDPNPDNNTNTDITPIDFSADLSVTKTAEPTPVVAGELLTYTLTVHNDGPNAAVNTVVTDAIPAELLNPEFSVGGSPIFSPWVSPYNAGTLAPGETIVITIRGRVASSAAVGTVISNTVTVASDTPDPNPDNNTDEIDVAVEVSADLAVTKQSNADTAVPGELIEYTITVSNLGPSDAIATVLIDAVSANILDPEFSTDGGGTWSPWLSPYFLGILAAGEERIIFLRGVVNPSATGSVLNTANVTSSTPDPNPDNNTDTDETPIENLADISVIKTANPDPVATGFPLTYMLTIQNFGPATSENVFLTDVIPNGLSDAEFSTDNGASWSPWVGTYLVGDLVSGASVTVLIRATVNADAPNTISNTAVVSSDTTDPNPENNTSTAEVDVVLSADLAVTKTANTATVQPSETLTYTITVRNFGPGAAQNATVTDNVSAQLENVEFSTDGGMTWTPWVGLYNAGTLDDGETLTLLIRGTVAVDAAGQIANTAIVDSDTPDPNPDNNTSTAEVCVCPECPIGGSADLSVVKTATASSLLPGSFIRYVVTVRNAGPDMAENVVLYDSIPSSVLNPEYSLDGGSSWHPWVSPLLLGALAADESVTVLLRGRVARGAFGVIENTAVITSDTPDPDPSNNTSTSQVEIAENADLGITKTAFATCVSYCDKLYYFLTVSNYGPNAAQNAVVTDRIGAELCNVQYSLDQGKTWYVWDGSLQLGTIAPSQTVVILLRGTVNCACGCINNTARVTSSTADLNLRNNEASASVPICSCSK